MPTWRPHFDANGVKTCRDGVFQQKFVESAANCSFMKSYCRIGIFMNFLFQLKLLFWLVTCAHAFFLWILR